MSRREASTPIERTFRTFLTDKGKGEGGSDGAYRRDAERELNRFLRWCRGNTPDPANASPPESWKGVVRDANPGGEGRDVRFADLDSTVFGDYARYLVVSGFANATVLTYYAYVASWCGWADAQGYVPRHYARESDAEDPLPESTGRRPGDQQAWSPEQRDRLTRYVDERASATLDAFGEIEVPADERGDPESEAVREKADARFTAYKRCRERALAYVLCYTGLRAAEFLDAPDDDRPGRNGIRWADVSLSDNNVTVYRKKQQWDEASLPDPVVGPLRRYRRLLDAPEDWPVFTTLHRPSLARHVTTGLRERGLSATEIDRQREGKPDLLVASEFGLDAPPALKPNGARRVLQRLCEAAEIAVDDDRHEYLAPHGGRRGMGEVMVREFGYAAAARYLDNSEEQVRQAYQHIEAAERADMATEALSNTDVRVRDDTGD
ncbi:site-specific integrase [Halorubrum sp. SD683]|uniref:site-specific integrase n=1 Tax=Halorubrum sp. SD683 TaxID=1855873 RepID=UPI000A2E203D|nr:site-specific integrase [Halorubrum sp. SD683]OTF01942.1 site-specific recombinase [Halorubrum sp. SD683]